MLADVFGGMQNWGHAVQQVVLISVPLPRTHALCLRLSPSECQDINRLSVEIRAQRFDVHHRRVCVQPCGCICCDQCNNMLQWQKTAGGKYFLFVETKSIQNVTRSCFIWLQMHSILKTHLEPERSSLQLQFIIIPLGSIEVHFCQ